MVLVTHKKIKESYSQACNEEFDGTLDRINLTDLPFLGEKWTWFTSREKDLVFPALIVFLFLHLDYQVPGVVQKL